MKKRVRVLIVVGSASDVEVMEKAGKVLSELGVEYELTVASAHRSPERVRRLATEARSQGVQVIIAAAGLSAALAGTLAAHTTLPVIGVPMAAGPLNGLDALLSTVQMPAGVPVATVAIGESGATNSALLALRILALSDPQLQKKLEDHRTNMAKAVEASAQKVKAKKSLSS